MHSNTVLLLEDDPVIALDIRLELEQQGFQVLTCGDVPTAVQLFEEHLPGMVLLNFSLKTMDGMALAKLLDNHHPTKIAFVTGARPQDLQASESFLQKYRVIYKPFTHRQLLSFLLP